jgi:hypothetical protein
VLQVDPAGRVFTLQEVNGSAVNGGFVALPKGITHQKLREGDTYRVDRQARVNPSQAVWGSLCWQLAMAPHWELATAPRQACEGTPQSLRRRCTRR